MISYNLYYRFKPFIPWPVRLALRRLSVKRRLASSAGTWPIKESAGRPPDGWKGWPEGKKFAFVLSHDVEGQKGLDRVPQLMQLEMDAGFRSSFNFIPEGHYHTPKALREKLTESGFEVGVHDLQHDGRLFVSRARFEEKARRINHYLQEWNAAGFRAGFMLRNLSWIGDLSIQYDASTFDTDPFEPQPDGADTIFPFWVARGEGRPPFVELPYTLPQDSTLFLYLREKTIDIWKRKMDWVADHGGMVLLNTHPDYVCFDDRHPLSDEYSHQLYREFLAYVQNRYRNDYWAVVPKTMAEWFSSNR